MSEMYNFHIFGSRRARRMKLLCVLITRSVVNVFAGGEGTVLSSRQVSGSVHTVTIACMEFCDMKTSLVKFARNR